jgi:protein SCO1/2
MSRELLTICLTFICLVQMPQLVCADAATDYARPMPKVGVTEMKGEFLPMDQGFIDEKGQVVRLKDFFKAGRPVIVSMNYSTCPTLCDTQLGGLVNVIDQMKWHAGDEFIVVSVSFDPNETPEQSMTTKQKYMEMDAHAKSPDSWNFLTGKSTGIKRLADALGIQYEYVGQKSAYAHPAVIVLCTPDGHISRYVYGVDFPVLDLQDWIELAAKGEIASDDKAGAFDFVMSCFYFDEKAGVYTAEAWIVLRVGAILFVLAIVGLTYYCHRLVKLAEKKRQTQRMASVPFLSEPASRPAG